MSHSVRQYALCVLLALAVAACSSGGGSRSFTLDGTYQGTLFLGGQPAATFTPQVTQTGNSASGTFTSGSQRGTFAANVSGSQFSAVLSGGGLACDSTGTYDDHSMSGALACAGGVNGSFQATRI